MTISRDIVELVKSLPAWGEWIEIGASQPAYMAHAGLSPHGESGLKSHIAHKNSGGAESLPARGEWVEILIHGVMLRTLFRLLPYEENGLILQR